MKTGLEVYTDRLVTEARRVTTFFKKKVLLLPMAPIPLCGTNDVKTIGHLLNLSLWLDNLP
jgi:hypothetical protein